MRARAAVVALVIASAVAACSAPAVPHAAPTAAAGGATPSGVATSPSDAATPDPASTPGAAPVVQPLDRLRISSHAGYVTTNGVAHVVPGTFTTVASFDVPASANGQPAAYVLGVRLVVRVPVEHALSVVGWCDTTRASYDHPHPYGLGQVLMSSQNPVPGNTKQETASRLLYGRALVDVPGQGGHCVIRISPRTEGTGASWLEVVDGKASANPLDLVTRGDLPARVLVGEAGFPQGALVAQSPVSAVVTGALVAHGEVELTACYGKGTYGLCKPTSFGASTVWARLVLQHLDDSGTVCATSFGVQRWISVTPFVHHAKLVLAPLRDPGTADCGDRVRTSIQVQHTSGTAMEIEATGNLKQPLTLSWVDR